MRTVWVGNRRFGRKWSAALPSQSLDPFLRKPCYLSDFFHRPSLVEHPQRYLFSLDRSPLLAPLLSAVPVGTLRRSRDSSSATCRDGIPYALESLLGYGVYDNRIVAQPWKKTLRDSRLYDLLDSVRDVPRAISVVKQEGKDGGQPLYSWMREEVLVPTVVLSGHDYKERCTFQSAGEFR